MTKSESLGSMSGRGTSMSRSQNVPCSTLSIRVEQRWSKVEQTSYRKRCSTTTRPRRGWGWGTRRGSQISKVEQIW